LITKQARHVIFTRPDSKRALAPDDLKNIFASPSVTSEVCTDCREAVGRALSMANGDELVCVTGSLYLVAEARSILLNADG